MSPFPRCWVVATLGALSLCANACRVTPLIRFGELEPPPGQRVLVDIWTRPLDRRPVPPDVIGALGNQPAAPVVLGAEPALSTDEARAGLSSQVQGPGASGSEARADAAESALDARRLESIYAAAGYFHARTRAWRVVDLTGRRARAEYDIEEGRVTRVKDVRFAGIEHLAADPEGNRRLDGLARELAGLVPFETGDVWTEDAYQSALDALGRAFRAQGFLYARVTGENWVSKDVDRVVVVFNIDHGPLVRAEGPPRVLNNRMVKTARALKRADIKAGDILDAPRLRAAERRLYGLGPLLSVQLRPVLIAADKSGAPPEPAPRPGDPVKPEVPIESPAPDAPGADTADDADTEVPRPAVVPLDLELQETTTWDFGVGLDFTTNFRNAGFGLPLTFEHRNVGDLYALHVSAKPVVNFSDFWKGKFFAYPTFVTNSRVALDIPSFFAEYLALSIGVSHNFDGSEANQRQELGAGLTFSVPLAAPLTLRFGWNSSYLAYLDRPAITTAEAHDLAALRIRDIDFAAWYDLALELDLRDASPDTRNGFWARAGARFGGPWSLSRSEFTQLQLELRGFYTPPFLPFLTLALRAFGGLVLFPSAEGTPSAARFLSGGQNSHRFFEANRMGDYLCKTAVDGAFVNAACESKTTDRDYVGGNYVFEINAETRLRLGFLDVVGFVDVGQVWSRASDVNLTDLVVAVGIGLGWASPAGPLRASAARRVDIHNGTTTIQLTFGQAF